VSATARTRRLTLVATALGSSLAFLDATVVIVALPRMETDLGLGLVGQQWVVLGYSVALSALLLVGGAVGDRIGLRATFTGGVVAFAAASLACALAPNAGLLVAGRALQGVGAAALTTTSLGLLRVVWDEQAGRAIGLWTSLTSVATVAGPPLGGLLVEVSSWRWVFLLNVPLAVVVVVLSLAGRSAAEREARRMGRFDPVGSALVAVGLASVTFALVEAQQRGAVVIVVLGAVGACSLGAFVWWTYHASSPLVPPRLLRLRGLVAANATTLLVYAALGTMFLLLPVYLQFLGLPPAVAGLALVPPGIALVLLAPRFGRYADLNGARGPVAAGATGIGIAALLLLPVDSRGDVWTWGAAAVAVLSVSLAALVAPITAAALAPAPGDLAGVAAGLNQTVARVGGVLSVAALGALAGWVYAEQGGEASTPFDPATLDRFGEAASDAFRAALLGVCALALSGAAIAAAMLEGRPRRLVVEQPEAAIPVSPCPQVGPSA
jgi:EmrB/QacA subfamily drug resistance transporter